MKCVTSAFFNHFLEGSQSFFLSSLIIEFTILEFIVKLLNNRYFYLLLLPKKIIGCIIFKCNLDL